MGLQAGYKRARPEASDSRRDRSVGAADQLASLTPLRGIAAMWVVVFHFCWHFPAIHPERYTGAVYKGYLAVDMFFVLSGFVITHVYKEAFARRVTSWRYTNFIKARVARIYPLHVSVLLLFVATAMAERAAIYALKGSWDPIPLVGERSLGGLLANLLMLQGLWARQLSWNDPAWSISLEFLAYLLFPLVAPVLWRTGPVGKAGIAVLLIAMLSWLAYRTGDYFNQWNGTYAVLRCLPEFLAGSLLYSAYQSRAFASLLSTDAAFATVAALLGVLLHISAPDLAIVLLFPPLILTAVCNSAYCAQVLNSAPLIWLGDISYSLYLLHWFVLFVISDFVRVANLSFGISLSLVPAMIGVCLALATISFRYVETTGRRWLRDRFEIRRPIAAMPLR